MKRPNPLNPHLMSPAERRAELCSLLALGLIRLKMRDTDQASEPNGEFPLHYAPNQRVHATPTHRRNS
jgi:hypothetical protein